MFRRNEHSTATRTGYPIEARGGVSGGAILTGVVVAFGAMFLLSAIIGGILAALGVAENDVTRSEAVDAGIGAGIALVLAQFFSYLWGGYTAGRMGRGAGVANGILVPVTAIILGLLTAGVVTVLGATANLNLPFTDARLPLENDYLVNWGIGIGIASVVAMFAGAAIGGGLGARWHSKLERDVYDEHTVTTTDTNRVATPTTTGGAAATSGGTIDLTEDRRTTGTPTSR